MDRLYRTRKRWGTEKGTLGTACLPKKSDRVEIDPIA
jgi:hypothetical protein